MSIPKEMQGKYDEIAALIIDFCNKKLNKDYKNLCLRLLEKLCRKRLSPLLSGRANTWAAGIVYAIGSNNFIFDKTQKVHLTANELVAPFGISASTASSKAAELKKMFRINYFNIEWLLPGNIENNSMIWMIQVNGFIVDVRDMSLEIQEQAFERGIIPYVPGERNEQKEKEERISNAKPTETLPQKPVDDDKQPGLF